MIVITSMLHPQPLFCTRWGSVDTSWSKLSFAYCLPTNSIPHHAIVIEINHFCDPNLLSIRLTFHCKRRQSLFVALCTSQQITDTSATNNKSVLPDHLSFLVPLPYAKKKTRHSFIIHLSLTLGCHGKSYFHGSDPIFGFTCSAANCVSLSFCIWYYCLTKLFIMSTVKFIFCGYKHGFSVTTQRHS